MMAMIIILIITFLDIKPASAQQNLTRISAAERADEQGHVIRFHLEEAVDSFKVRQPFLDLVQVHLYKENIDPDLIRVFETKAPFRGVELKQIEGGIGVNIHLVENAFLKSNVYPDVNNTDLLLAFTQTNEEELKMQTADVHPVSWVYPISVEGADTVIEDLPEFSEEEYDNARDLFDEVDNFASESLKFEVVVIDAGHGGRDPGAIGHGGVREKDITLSVARKLGNYIEEHLPDLEVVYTRDDDTFVGLEERGQIANRANGDLFISLHANSNHSSQPAGSEVYFLGLHRSEQAFEMMKKENAVVQYEDEEERSEELTREELVVYELANIGNIASSEVFAGLTERQFEERARRRSRGVKQAGFIVLYHASMPAVLVELGFISNGQEKNFLTSEYGQAIMASAVFRAVRDYKGTIDRSQNNGDQP